MVGVQSCYGEGAGIRASCAGRERDVFCPLNYSEACACLGLLDEWDQGCG